jgi:hypothetical protein
MVCYECIGMTIADLVFGLEVLDLVHVLQAFDLVENAEPVLDWSPVLLLN